MASDNWNTTSALDFVQILKDDPYEFDFFHAIRCLENARPNKPRVGYALHAIEDVVRLSQVPSLAFAPSTLESFEPEKDGHPGCLAVYFFGLLGPNGPLPLHFTEYAIQRIKHHHDKTFARFLDIFNHRMLSFFYRARASAEPTVSLDRPGSDRFADYVGSLFGFGLASTRHRDAMPDLAKLYYAGHLASESRSVEGLQAILSDFFEVPVRIVEFVGQWLSIPPDQRSLIDSTYQSATLGMDFTLGERVWDRQNRFRIVMGPMDLNQHMSFLPGSRGWHRIVAVVRNYVGVDFDWDLQLILDDSELIPEEGKEPLFSLGRTGALGWTTWVTHGELSHDRENLVLSLEAYEVYPERADTEATETRETREVST
jgi:type VI secretion system protein ImpH